MTHDEAMKLAALMARGNIVRKLLEMNADPKDAKQRVSYHEHGRTYEWLEAETAMFDALMMLETLGYTITKARK